MFDIDGNFSMTQTVVGISIHDNKISKLMKNTTDLNWEGIFVKRNFDIYWTIKEILKFFTVARGYFVLGKRLRRPYTTLLSRTKENPILRIGESSEGLFLD